MVQEKLTLYKLIVLYMLNKVKFQLTYSQISGLLLEKEYMDFMTMQQVLSELADTGLVKSDTLMNRTYFSITDEGHETLSYFENRIDDTIKDEINTLLAENHHELKNESSIKTDYHKTASGPYIAELIAKERDTELVNIKLMVPSEDMAEMVCRNWHAKNEEIYKYIMAALF